MDPDRLAEFFKSSPDGAIVMRGRFTTEQYFQAAQLSIK